MAAELIDGTGIARRVRDEVKQAIEKMPVTGLLVCLCR